MATRNNTGEDERVDAAGRNPHARCKAHTNVHLQELQHTCRHAKFESVLTGLYFSTQKHVSTIGSSFASKHCIRQHAF